MKKDHPVSVYFTGRERQMLSKLSKHCKRPQSDQVRWMLEQYFYEVFGNSKHRR